MDSRGYCGNALGAGPRACPSPHDWCVPFRCLVTNFVMIVSRSMHWISFPCINFLTETQDCTFTLARCQVRSLHCIVRFGWVGLLLGCSNGVCPEYYDYVDIISVDAHRDGSQLELVVVASMPTYCPRIWVKQTEHLGGGEYAVALGTRLPNPESPCLTAFRNDTARIRLNGRLDQPFRVRVTANRSLQSESMDTTLVVP